MESLSKSMESLGKSLESLKEINGIFKGIDEIRKEIDGILREIDGIRKEINGILREIDEIIKEIIGIHKEITGILKEIDEILEIAVGIFELQRTPRTEAAIGFDIEIPALHRAQGVVARILIVVVERHAGEKIAERQLSELARGPGKNFGPDRTGEVRTSSDFGQLSGL